MRSINPENIAYWFDPYKLKATFMYQGYENYCVPIAHLLGVTEQSARSKISASRLTHEETIILARFLRLNPQEYCDIFLKGLFVEEKEDRT